ncbi:hypothetical protein [Desulfomicrobium escambiense]|uniref:hypothetical protein n=1 Tax=Desulfomicrobium escambiense TaxID=29503 RepID=UPI00048DE42E|nr:hypothetical protein [Desulfomicrobium escambiense]
MSDPFTRLPLPDDRDQLLKVAHLAALARENGIHFQVVGGWILPTTPLPWTPERATALRRTLHHVERCRGFLQAHSEAFPVMPKAEAEKWLADLHRHHGAALPCWWSKAVVGIAEQIQRMVEV